MRDELSQFKAIVAGLHRHQDLLAPLAGLNDVLHQVAPHLALADIANPSLRHNVQFEVLSDLCARLSETTAISEILKINQIPTLCSPITKILEEHRSITELLRPHLDFTADLALNVSALVDASSIWKSSIDAAIGHFNTIGLVGIRDDLIARLLSPSRAFSSFMKDATAQLGDITEASRIVAASASLKIVEGQFESITDLIGRLPAPADSLEAWTERALTSPMVQFEAALETDLGEDAMAEPNSQLILIPATQCAEAARATMDYVFRANEISVGTGKGEMFKPTTRFAEACVDLSWLVATDKKSFGDFIDCLYFIFYEGPGKDSLRFLDKHGGPMKTEELDFIWCIKHLRNKYSRHDPDHGNPADIAKSWAALQEKWIMLGLAVAPSSNAQFFHAQQSLIRMAQQFMESVLSRMTGEAQSN